MDDLFKYVTIAGLLGILVFLILIFLQNRERLRLGRFSNINETKEYFDLKTRLNVAIAAITIIGFLLVFFGFDTIDKIENRTASGTKKLMKNLEADIIKFQAKQAISDSTMSLEADELQARLQNIEVLLGNKASSASKRIAQVEAEYEGLMTYMTKLESSLPKRKFVLGKQIKPIPAESWIEGYQLITLNVSDFSFSPPIKSFSGVKVVLVIWRGNAYYAQVGSSSSIGNIEIKLHGPTHGGDAIMNSDIILFY